MNIQQIFNLILLTLSLATILLTLVSYVLYRMKQSGSGGRKSNALLIQGVFFRRYYLDEMLPKPEVLIPKKKNTIEIPRKIIPFFGVVSIVIFISLTFSMIFKTAGNTKSHVGSYKELIEKGLMKNFNFQSVKTDEIIQEYISLEQRKRNQDLLVELRKKNILLVARHESSRTPKLANPVTEKAVNAWRAYLTSNQIPFELSNEIKFKANSMMIFPEAITLSEVEREKITQCISKSMPVLLTGPLGTSDWSKVNLGVQFVKAEDAKYYPTMFKADIAPFWDIPPGLVLDWNPTVNDFKALSEPKQTAAYESSYDARASRFARIVFNKRLSSRTVWLAHDPIFSDHWTPSEKFYSEVMLNSVLAWGMSIPIARVSAWPEGAHGATLVSVDTEDKFENAKALREIFTRHKIPSTFFVVSNLYQKNSMILNPIDESIEIASHSENHSIFAGQAASLQFDRIQTSRFEIEELTEKSVRGFRAPEERSDLSTLVAVVQNQLEYIATNGVFIRFAPAWIAGGKLLLFPRTNLDDFGVKKMKQLSPKEMSAALIQESARTREFTGLNILNLHTHVFGESDNRKILSDTLDQLIKEDTWFSTYSQTTKWWKARNQIISSIAPVPDEPLMYQLIVQNPTDQVIDGVTLNLDLGNKEISDERGPAQEAENNSLFKVGTIGPHEEKRIKIHTK